MGHADTDETMALQLFFVNRVCVCGCIQMIIKILPINLTHVCTKYGTNTKQQIEDPYLHISNCLCAQNTYLTLHKSASLTLIHATLKYS